MRDLIITIIIIVTTLEDMILDLNLENIEINIRVAKIFQRAHHHLIGIVIVMIQIIVIVMIQITVIVMIHVIANLKSEVDLLLLLIDTVAHLLSIKLEDMTLKVLALKVEGEVLVVETTPTTKNALENDGRGLIDLYLALSNKVKHRISNFLVESHFILIVYFK